MPGSVPSSLCSRGSNSSSSCDDIASASKFSKFTVTGSTITADTAEPTDISIEELEDDIVSYTNKGNEVSIDSPVNFVWRFNCSTEPSSIVAEEMARNEVAAIKNWGSEFSQHFADFQLQISPNAVELSSVPPEIVIAGSLGILKDPEIRICDTGTSNHLTFSKVGCSVKFPSEIQSQKKYQSQLEKQTPRSTS